MEAFNMSHPSHPDEAFESRVMDLLISCQAAADEFNLTGINIENALVTGLSTNSQDVKPGDIFIALNGLNMSGHDFIDQAIDKGAVAVFADTDETFSFRYQLNTQVFFIPNLAVHLSQMASGFYREPSQQLSVVGITGTNGKTSCSHFVASLVSGVGRQGAVIGTLGYGPYPHSYERPLVETGFTTPDAIQLQSCLADLQAQAVDLVALEVSSHALSQCRADSVAFNVAVLTNLSRDHLDFHQDMLSYAKAKRKLFSFSCLDAAIINIDDEFGLGISEELPSHIVSLSYSLKNSEADIYAYQTSYKASSIETLVKTPYGEGSLQLPFVGQFNLSNALAALGALLVSGYALRDLLRAFSTVPMIPGRMEVVSCSGLAVDEDPLVVVDYAHTPEALELALTTLRDHCTGHIWCVFGCGGDRDHGKRATMGRIAHQLADQIIVTSDNPRSELAEQIIDDILLGIEDMQGVFVEQDRSAAIAFAVQHATQSDVILIAGKGHEQFQLINNEKISFSDIVVAESFLKVRASL